MSIFPKIQSPCPYKSELSKYMEGDLCRMCDRRVVDLNPLSDTERVALVSGCKDQICVSYNLRPAVAAALTLAAIGVPMSAAAQDTEVEEIVLVAGGILDPIAVEYDSDEADRSIPAMPVIYDDAPPAPDEPASIPANQTPNPQTSNE